MPYSIQGGPSGWIARLVLLNGNLAEYANRECSQVRMVNAISQPGCAECGAGGLVLTDYRPYAFLRALLQTFISI